MLLMFHRFSKCESTVLLMSVGPLDDCGITLLKGSNPDILLPVFFHVRQGN
jgi:hypothetical protein